MFGVLRDLCLGVVFDCCCKLIYLPVLRVRLELWCVLVVRCSWFELLFVWLFAFVVCLTCYWLWVFVVTDGFIVLWVDDWIYIVWLNAAVCVWFGLRAGFGLVIGLRLWLLLCGYACVFVCGLFVFFCCLAIDYYLIVLIAFIWFLYGYLLFDCLFSLSCFVGFVLIVGYCFCFVFVVYLYWIAFVCVWLLWVLLLLYCLVWF